MARLLPALLLLYGLFIAAITAITRISACQTRIIAFTVLLLTVGLLAVAALVAVSVIIERPTLELLLCFCENIAVFVVVVAAVACAVGRAHLSDRETLTVHFDTVSFLTRASRLLFFRCRHFLLQVLSVPPLHQRHPKRVLLIAFFQQLTGGLLFCLFIEAGEGKHGVGWYVLMCLYESQRVVDVAYGRHVEDDRVVILGEVARAHSRSLALQFTDIFIMLTDFCKDISHPSKKGNLQGNVLRQNEGFSCLTSLGINDFGLYFNPSLKIFPHTPSKHTLQNPLHFLNKQMSL